MGLWVGEFWPFLRWGADWQRCLLSQSLVSLRVPFHQTGVRPRNHSPPSSSSDANERSWRFREVVQVVRGEAPLDGACLPAGGLAEVDELGGLAKLVGGFLGRAGLPLVSGLRVAVLASGRLGSRCECWAGGGGISPQVRR